MSTWYEPKKDSISLSDDKTELHILFDTNDNGNVYVSVLVEDIKDLLKE